MVTQPATWLFDIKWELIPIVAGRFSTANSWGQRLYTAFVEKNKDGDTLSSSSCHFLLSFLTSFFVSKSHCLHRHSSQSHS